LIPVKSFVREKLVWETANIVSSSFCPVSLGALLASVWGRMVLPMIATTENTPFSGGTKLNQSVWYLEIILKAKPAGLLVG